jgi:hypothetical protein
MQSDSDGRGAAEQAFEDLRAEVSVLRRAVEALPAEWNANQSPDYTESLGQIVQGLTQIAGRLQVIEQHPVLKLAPAQLQAALAAAGQELVGRAAARLDGAVAAFTREQQALADVAGTVRGKRKQRQWLAIAAAAALATGLVVCPFAARLLPFGWDAGVAATILNADRWQAGQVLLKSADPQAWETVSAANDLIEPNRAALAACRETARRTRKEQHCMILVPTP